MAEGMGIHEIIPEEYVLWKDDGRLNQETSTFEWR